MKQAIVCLLGIICWWGGFSGFAQNQYLISGKVIDKDRRPLPNVLLHISHIGSLRSGIDGTFSFNLPSKIHKIKFSIKDQLPNQDTLLIAHPSRGIWNVPQNPSLYPLQIRLLARGNQQLLNTSGLLFLVQKMIDWETEKRIKKLLTQKSPVKPYLNVLTIDPLKQETQYMGFSRTELSKALEKIRLQLQKSSDPYQVALFALYDKQFREAAILIENAMETMQKKLGQQYPGLAGQYLNLGNAYIGDHKLSKAITAYQAAIKIQPLDFEGYFRIGKAFYAMKNMEAARKNLKKSLQINRREYTGETNQNEAAITELLGIILSDFKLFDNAKTYFKNSLKIYQRINHQQGKAVNLNNLGVLFRDIGSPDSAGAYHLASFKLYHQLGDKHGQALNLANLGAVSSDIGFADSAGVYYQASFKLYHQLGDKRGQAAQLSNLGRALSDLGQSENAQAYFKKSFHIYHRLEDKYGQAVQLSWLGGISNDLERPDIAKIYFKDALKLYRQIGDKQKEADQLGDLGVAFSDLGRPDTAKICFKDALKLYLQIDDEQGQANQLGDLGVVFRDLGQADSAKFYHQAALKIDRKIGDRQSEAIDLGNLGIAYRELGQADSAKYYYLAALKINQEIGDRQSEADQLGNLAILFVDVGELDSARVYLTKALNIHRQIGYQEGEAIDLGNLARIYHKVAMLDSALVYHRMALNIDRRIGHRQSEANQLGNLGLIYRKLGKFDSARVYLLESSKIFTELESPGAQFTMVRVNEINEMVNRQLIVKGDQYQSGAKFDSAYFFYMASFKDSRSYGYTSGKMRALNRLSTLFQEHTLQFTDAFKVDRQRLKLAPDDLDVLSAFAEKNFTTARFKTAGKYFTALIGNPKLNSVTKTALQAIEIANLLAMKESKSIKNKLSTLLTTVASQPDTFKVNWSFTGVRAFIRRYKPLRQYRQWLFSLFEALKAKNQAVIFSELQDVNQQFYLIEASNSRVIISVN